MLIQRTSSSQNNVFGIPVRATVLNWNWCVCVVGVGGGWWVGNNINWQAVVALHHCACSGMLHHLVPGLPSGLEQELAELLHVLGISDITKSAFVTNKALDTLKGKA